MKRSEAIKKLMHKCISPYEIIKQSNYDTGEYERRAERLLTFIEKELRMLPESIIKVRKLDVGSEYTESKNIWEEE